MRTIHIIFSSHIDPVWLWPWQSGLGEVLATCRSACDRLDAHPDLVFTRGEAWAYEQIERIDPTLFARIKSHVSEGRWEVVGGWYLQPDCNLPSYWAMERQVRLGQEFFTDRFGFFPRTAFNVDSFGHSAALPGLMRAFGQDSYLTTRPSWEEMEQPGRVFRWRGYADGPEVIVVHPPFSNSDGVQVGVIHESIERLPAGFDHAICCLGVGDHGGGPTEQQIAWCRKNEHLIPGWQLEFSSLERFLDVARAFSDRLPLVVGELQPHSIGCYSVYRQVKVAMRRAEHLLAQAETLGEWDTDIRRGLDLAWRRVAFNHFHDTLAGTSTPSAYEAVLGQLGGAYATADEALHYGLRKKIVELPDDPLQRIVVLNADNAPFEGYVEHEPWVGPWTRRWLSDCYLVDEDGTAVEFQLMDAESIAFSDRSDTVLPRLLFPVKLGEGEVRTFRIMRDQNAPKLSSRVTVRGNDTITNHHGVEWSPDGLKWPERDLLPIRLDMVRDMSDTWSHGLSNYSENATESATWGDPVVVDSGPLMACIIVEGAIGRSLLKAEWRVYAESFYVELRLNVHWIEQFRLLKLVIPLEATPITRIDGVMDSHLIRRNAGGELPLRDWTLVEDGNDMHLGIVAPDVYGIDATPDRVRLTLLRSPMAAHHDPAPARTTRGQFTDQGPHAFRFRFFRGSEVTTDMLDWHARMMQRPVVIADATGGMPTVRTLQRLTL